MGEEGKEASAKKQESPWAEEGLMGPQEGRVRNHLASRFSSRQETWPHQECHEAAGSSWTSQQMLGADLGLGVLSDREEPGNQTSRVRIQDCHLEQVSSALTFPHFLWEMFYHN